MNRFFSFDGEDLLNTSNGELIMAGTAASCKPIIVNIISFPPKGVENGISAPGRKKKTAIC
jgi:hypothetical protein